MNVTHTIPEPTNLNRQAIHLLANGYWLYDHQADDLDCEHLLITVPADWNEGQIWNYVKEYNKVN